MEIDVTTFRMRVRRALREFKMLCICCFLLEGFAAGAQVLQLGIQTKLPQNYCEVWTPLGRVWLFAVAFTTLLGGGWLAYDLARWYLRRAKEDGPW